MKYFKATTNDNNDYETLAGEVINIFSGKELFDMGKPIKPRDHYMRIITDASIVDIETNRVYIYTSKQLSFSKLEQAIANLHDVKYKREFMVVPSDKSYITTKVHMPILKIMVHDCKKYIPISTTNPIVIVYDLNKFVNKILNYEYNKLSEPEIFESTIRIIYDHDDIFMYPHNHKTDQLTSLDNFTMGYKIKPMPVLEYHSEYGPHMWIYLHFNPTVRNTRIRIKKCEDKFYIMNWSMVEKNNDFNNCWKCNMPLYDLIYYCANHVLVCPICWHTKPNKYIQNNDTYVTKHPNSMMDILQKIDITPEFRELLIATSKGIIDIDVGYTVGDTLLIENLNSILCKKLDCSKYQFAVRIHIN